jgi:hypothetical protein
MKRLVKGSVTDKIHVAENAEHENEVTFGITDLVDIMHQIEELNAFNIAARNHEGTLQLQVGDSIYEIDVHRTDKRYPRRRVRKVELEP